MSEKKDFCDVKLVTLNNRGGFTRIKSNHAIRGECQQKDKDGCLHRSNGYHCSECPNSKSDGITLSQCFATLGFTPQEVESDKPFGYRVSGVKEVGLNKQYVSFCCNNGIVTYSLIKINETS